MTDRLTPEQYADAVEQARRKLQQLADDPWDDLTEEDEQTARALLQAEAELKELRTEREKLRELAACVLLPAFAGYDADGGSVQNAAERLGLIVRVAAPEEWRSEYEQDWWFVLAWSDAAKQADAAARLAARATTGEPGE